MAGPRPARSVVTVALWAIAVLGAAGACTSLDARFSGPDGDRRLYQARCGFCHVPYLPHDYTAEEWPRLVNAMAGRAGLTRTARKRVLVYLQNRSAEPR